MPANSTGPVLLFDGACGFCRAAVGFILQHEKRHDLRFARRQGAFAAAVLARHPELPGIDSVVWLEPARDGMTERILVRADAALRVAEYLGGWWRGAIVARLLPRRWRDAAYGLVARHRRRIPASVSRDRLAPDRLLD
jgi:predicted DCC family thiol-disulfide oxidoreductase YuxK